MTDLPTILPNFPTGAYTHLLPSLDRHGVTVTDLLSLDALEIAKRASLPILDLRRLAQDVIHALQGDLGVDIREGRTSEELLSPSSNIVGKNGRQRPTDAVKLWDTISFLDAALDSAIGGGIPTGYVTEITGERCGEYLTVLRHILMDVVPLERHNSCSLYSCLRSFQLQ
jgi:DNA repair protein RAD57